MKAFLEEFDGVREELRLDRAGQTAAELHRDESRRKSHARHDARARRRRSRRWPTTTGRSGQLVDRVSHSRYWPETAIFVIEDDAQNGSDHVDARRTMGFVISPYTKRKVGRLHALHDVVDGADDRAVAGPAADDAVRCRGDADVCVVRHAARTSTPYKHLPPQVDVNARNSRRAPGREGVDGDGFLGIRSHADVRAERSDLEKRPRRRQRNAAADQPVSFPIPSMSRQVRNGCPTPVQTAKQVEPCRGNEHPCMSLLRLSEESGRGIASWILSRHQRPLACMHY